MMTEGTIYSVDGFKPIFWFKRIENGGIIESTQGSFVIYGFYN
jgi:hypothetical protein